MEKDAVYTDLRAVKMAEDIGSADCSRKKTVKNPVFADARDPEVRKAYTRGFTACNKRAGRRKKTQRRKTRKVQKRI